MTHNMALHHGRDNIRVNCIAPGMIYSSMVAGRAEGELRALRRKAAPLGTEGKWLGYCFGRALSRQR
ncbi:MAG: SDR family oxidoreductase [Caldilineaceae bacterium]